MIDLYNGDCLDVMKQLIEDGVQLDSIVCDPPYHLTSIVDRFGKEGSAPAQHGTDGAFARASKGFMGKEWDGGDIAFRKETWELAMKLLKPGGHLLAFSGSRTYHRMAVAIEDAGFEIRDQIMWLYGSGFPKSHNISKAIDKAAGVEFSSKPAEGVGFMGPDGPGGYNVTQNQMTREGESTPEAQEWEGWGTALKPAHEPIVLARKPIAEKSIADNVLKHGTGAINIGDCKVGEEVRHNPSSKGDNAIYSEMKGVEDDGRDTISRFPANVIHNGLNEDWAHYFYCPKTSTEERTEINDHPTVKPQELMKYLCRLVTPKKGLIMDLFMGSGSTGVAAKTEGFSFIGIEKDPDYFKICETRINDAQETATLEDFFDA
jgi:DNA modification methylase